MEYFVQGGDGEGVEEQLNRFAEDHWAYMDAHAARLVARGPTLSADGAHHTGSVHVVEADTIEDARRFAFEEPYWMAGTYAWVTVTRLHPARAATMWDRPRPAAGPPSSLVLVNWPGQPFAPSGDADAHLLGRLAETGPLVFGGMLTDDDASRSVGLVAAVDADLGPAAALVAGLGLPGATMSLTCCRWRRGGRDQS